MCEAHQLHTIRTINVHLIIRLPRPTGMIIPLHHPVLAKARIKLCPSFCYTEKKANKN